MMPPLPGLLSWPACYNDDPLRGSAVLCEAICVNLQPSTTRSVEFSDSRVVVFEDKFQAVVIEPPKK